MTPAEYDVLLDRIVFQDVDIQQINAARIQKIKRSPKWATVAQEDIDKWMRDLWLFWLRCQVHSMRTVHLRREKRQTKRDEKGRNPPVDLPQSSPSDDEFQPSPEASMSPIFETANYTRESSIDTHLSESMSATVIRPPEQIGQRPMDPAARAVLDVFLQQGTLTLKQVLEWVTEKM